MDFADVSAVSLFLRGHPPFSAMEAEHVARIARSATRRTYAPGEPILLAGATPTLHIVERGQVVVEGTSPEGDEEWVFGPGEFFPISALMADRPVASGYGARDEVVCLVLPAETFRYLERESPPFHEFCARRVAALLEQSIQTFRGAQRGGAGDRWLDRPLASLAPRKPISCPPETPVRAVLETMHRERIGSIIVVDADRRPLGVFTLHDVLEKVALGGVDQSAPIGRAMSHDLWTLPASAPAFEAALLMARENIRHVPLVDGERLVGVVSESRLFSLWRGGIGEVRAAIRAARDVDAVAAAAARGRALPERLLEEGLTSDAITGLVTALNDLVTGRLIELTGADMALRAARACWFALGSEGRGEQTLATDQDNAIVFADDGDPEARRRALVAAAVEVNRALDTCGFPLCRGEVMASNPSWCLSQTEWRERFAQWMDRPEPAALLNAAIFFDFRPIYGDSAPVAALRDWLTSYAPDRAAFLVLLAQNALSNQPPLGLVRDFVLSTTGDHPQTIDLKVNGVQPFVEAARVYALASGVTATNTLERLAGVGRARHIEAVETEAWSEAFRFIQLLRLRLNTAQRARGEPVHNHLDPATLNDLERRILKEAFRQARKLQTRLAKDFRLNAIGGFGV